MTETFVHTFSEMGTVITFRVVGTTTGTDRAACVARAAAWFRTVTATFTRFEPSSELSMLSGTRGAPVVVSEMLFEALRFAISVAEASDGAFDPTLGASLVARGFDREFRKGARVAAVPHEPGATFRDVVLDERDRTVTLARAMQLDLGAVVKGLAVDLAARELAPLRNFAIDAGGDLYLAGRNERGEAWNVGIRHPRDPDGVFEAIHVSDSAVCTSGDYERISPMPRAGHHILDPRTRSAAGATASATVIAPTAMVADALATAAFVLGPVRGITFLESQDVRGILITPALGRFATAMRQTAVPALHDA